MTRSLLKLLALGVLTVGAWGALFSYERQAANPARVASDVKAVEAAEAKELGDVAARIAAAPRRVAGLLVTDQSPAAPAIPSTAPSPATAPTSTPASNPSTTSTSIPSTASGGTVRTTLVFQEYANDGSALPPKRFTIEGNAARVEAEVLHFQGQFAKSREPLRGLGLPLFLHLAGEGGAESAHPIDDPGRIPAVYRGPDVTVSGYEQQLWRDFWRLADDELHRSRAGVRATFGQVEIKPLEMGRLYTLTLNPDATMTVTSEPLKEGYLEMLKQDEQKVVPQTGPAAVPGAGPATSPGR